MSILVFFNTLGILLFIFQLIAPIKFKALISYNILKNKGIIKLFFFKWNFISFKFKIKQKYLLLKTKKGKTLLLPFITKSENDIEIVDLGLVIFQKITINTLKLKIDAGFYNDPCKTALTYGLLQIISSSILSVVKTKKLSVIIENEITPNFKENSGTIYLSSSLSVTIYDLLWAFICYKLKIIKNGGYYERRRI